MQAKNTFQLPVVLKPALILLLPDPLPSLHVFMGTPLYCLLLMVHAGPWWAWAWGEFIQCTVSACPSRASCESLESCSCWTDIESLWPSKFTCLWDCHSPACVPCLVGLAVAVDLLLLQPALDWTMTDWADGRGPGTASGEKAPGPCYADLTQEVRTWRCASEFTDECGRCSKCREWLAGTILSLWLYFRERML